MLKKQRSCEKFVRLTLMKLTTGDFEGVRGVRLLRRHTSRELSRELPQSDGKVLDDRQVRGSHIHQVGVHI